MTICDAWMRKGREGWEWFDATGDHATGCLGQEVIGSMVNGSMGYFTQPMAKLKLFGITYLVGKIKFIFFFRVHWLSEL